MSVRLDARQYVKRYETEKEGGKELWAEPAACPITMSEENEHIDNDL